MAELFNGREILINSLARYACDPFGDDSVRGVAWEKVDRLKDLTLGDGVDPDTFPTLTLNDDHKLTYYAFDGIDDYMSNWPAMPAEYTVFAALSSAYPSGNPYVQACNDATIKTLLTTPGSFTGNLHNLVILDHEAGALEAAYLEYRMLLRCWRQTYADPITARYIRSGECVLQMYFQDEASKFVDYAQGLTATDYSTGWDEGVTYPSASAAVSWSDASLELESMTMIWEMPGWDLTPNEDAYLMQNGTSAWLKMDDSSPAPGVDGDLVISMGDGTNTSTLTVPRSTAGYRFFAVTLKSGQVPRFYADGQPIGYGDTALTPVSTNANPLYLCNDSARNNAHGGTVKKFSVFTRALSASEIKALTFAATLDRGFA